MSHLRTFLVASALLLAACSSSGNKVPAGEVMTKERQQAMTPAQAVQRLKDGNDRFTSGRSQHRDLVAEARETAKGQYPLAVVLSCIDSRTPPELIFDQGLGDIFVPRIAGNYAPAGILGSIEFATKIMGAKVI
ncbi:MAG: carbonic anhydrase, partial [Phycisphaerae bacterium]|nr:carbonic anhydrase [Phycisphaerae bacterium]